MRFERGGVPAAGRARPCAVVPGAVGRRSAAGCDTVRDV